MRVLNDSSSRSHEILEKVKSKLTDLLHDNYPLYSIQEEALERLIEETEKRNHLVFQLPTGGGKTRVAAAYLWSLFFLGKIKNGDKILFLTPRVVIKQQVVKKEFNQLLREPFKVKEFSTGKCKFDALSEELHNELNIQGSSILLMVITPQLLSKHYHKFGERDYRNVKVVLLDEGHYMYWGQQIGKAVFSLLKDKERIVLAFTATPTKELIKSLGPLVYYYHSLNAMKDGILTSDLKVRIYNTMITDRDVKIGTYNFNRVYISNRAQKYVEEIIRILEEEAHELGHSLQERIPKTLIIAANVSEANEIYDELFKFIKELDQNTRMEKDEFRKTHFCGCAHYALPLNYGDPRKNIEEFKKSSGGVLVTVNMADMGFDDKNLEVLVIARKIETPTAYVQIRGRVLRKCDSNVSTNIKRQKGYAVLVDLAGSARNHENREKIEQVERGEYSLKGVYADLRGPEEGRGIRKVEADVEIKLFKTFKVREEIEKSEEIERTAPLHTCRENFIQIAEEPNKKTFEGKCLHCYTQTVFEYTMGGVPRHKPKVAVIAICRKCGKHSRVIFKNEGGKLKILSIKPME